ncbi:MAG: alkaline phosphatase [Treponema sp.]|nr:alkaline phosphatase [Treponema sp.]
MKGKLIFRLFVSALVCVMALSCAVKTSSNITEENLIAPSKGKAKYVFLFIGDGMAMTQINAAEVFSAARQSSDINITRLGFTQFPVTGLTTTHDAGTFITDSASAGTAIATGYKTLSGVINMDATLTNNYKNIAEYAKESGRKVGIVSSVTLNHATPAVFYGSVPSRGNTYDLAVQAANSNVDYFAGGAFSQRTGRNRDQQDAMEIAKSNGFTYIDTTAGFNALKAGAGKVIVVAERLQDSEAMPYEIDRKTGEPSLADLTKKGIELLDNSGGFFMMIESGKIDWAGHANDAGANIHDVLSLDAAINIAVEFAKRHPNETLIVVTGDHETGGMTIGFAGTQYDTFFDKIALQKRSYVAFDEEILKPYKARVSAADAKIDDLLPSIKESFGVNYDSLTAVQKEQIQFAFQRTMGSEQIRSFAEDQYLLYGGYEPLTVKLTQILNQTAGIGWTSYAHTGVPVTTFAYGIHQEIFGGYYDNTDIFYKLASAMNIRVNK